MQGGRAFKNEGEGGVGGAGDLMEGERGWRADERGGFKFIQRQQQQQQQTPSSSKAFLLMDGHVTNTHTHTHTVNRPTHTHTHSRNLVCSHQSLTHSSGALLVASFKLNTEPALYRTALISAIHSRKKTIFFDRSLIGLNRRQQPQLCVC